MRLNDALVTSFVYNDKKYTINLAFDTVLDVFDYLDNETLREHEMARICLALLLGNQAYDETKVIDLWNYIYKNFIHGEEKQAVEYDLKGNPMPVVEEEDNERFIDLEQDAEYIYASFKQAYNMDLYEEQTKLHWQVFKALLSSLPEDTIMQKIISIRRWEPSKGDSSKHKSEMRKLQKLHALHDVKSEEVD